VPILLKGSKTGTFLWAQALQIQNNGITGKPEMPITRKARKLL